MSRRPLLALAAVVAFSFSGAAFAAISNVRIVSGPARGYSTQSQVVNYVGACQGQVAAPVPVADDWGLALLAVALMALALIHLRRSHAALLIGLCMLAAAADLPPEARAQTPSCLDLLEWEARRDDGVLVATGFGETFSFAPSNVGEYTVTLRVPGPAGADPLHEVETTLGVCPANLTCDGDRFLIDLGQGEHNFYFDQMLSVGADVTDFDFELHFTDLATITGARLSDWPVGVGVEIYDGTGQLVDSYDASDVSGDPDAAVTTPTIDGNVARIVVTTSGVPVALGSTTHLVLRRVEASLRTEGPPVLAESLELHSGVETIAYLLRPGSGQQVFHVDLPQPGLRSIYVSPLQYDTPRNDVGLTMGWSLRSPGAAMPSTWDTTEQPRGGDTGIYKEIEVGDPAGARLFLAVEGTRHAFYRITVQAPRELLGSDADPLVVEMDGILDGDASPTLTTHRTVDWAEAYWDQIDAFIEDDATYNQRVVEALVINSASLLAATEGYFRLARVDFYHSFDSLRDADISFDGDCGRANAMFHAPLGPIASINMFREAANDPFDGGITLTHEWGHYLFSIYDEYDDVIGTVDLNSAMGSQRRAIDFCGELNHQSTHPSGLTISADSAWLNVQMAFGVAPPRPPTSATAHFPQNQGLYLDVLNELEALLQVVEFPNAVPTGQPVNGECTAIGDPCSDHRDCSFDSLCDATAGMCVPATGSGNAGISCTADDQCESRYCDGSDRCSALGVIGDDCFMGRRLCEDGRRCDYGPLSQNTERCIPDDGEGAPGDFCSHDNQCGPGDFCDLVSGQNYGACSGPLPLGGDCDGSYECQSGACDPVSDTCVPINGTGSTGAYCTQDAHCQSNDCLSNACRSFAAIGDYCANGRICAGGRRCDSGPGTQNTGRCIPNDGQGQVGQYCSHNNHCLSGDFCDLVSGQNYGACSDPLPLGGDCDGSYECQSGACDPVSDTCVPINGTGSTGAYCTQDAHCQSNDCLSNACRSFAAIGDYCANGRICAGGRRCDSGPGTQNTGRCIPNDGQGQVGQYCSHNNHCLSGDFCDLVSGQNYGACSDPLPLGGDCDGSYECQSGACDPVSDTCVPINGTGSTGAYCTQDAHCQSNDCLSNACRSFAAIGDYCANGRICAGGRRCDSGPGTQNTGRCIPNDGQGESGDFCSHNNQCEPGRPCLLQPGVNYGACF